MSGPRLAARWAPGPWFRPHPRAAVMTAVALFAFVLALRLLDHDGSDPVTLLATLPIALVSIAFGRRPGVVAGCIGVGCQAVWVLSEGVSLSLLGWLSGTVPLLLLGALIGTAADGLEAAAEVRRRAEEARLREREAIDINEGIVQNLVAAKWSLEAGRYDQSLSVLTETIVTAQALIVELLAGKPITPIAKCYKDPHGLTSVDPREDGTGSRPGSDPSGAYPL